MTALCGGGTSTVIPGKGSSVVVDAALITGGLTLISPWLIPLAGLVDGFVYDALASCSSDPPAMPTFNATDISNCIGGVFNPNCETTITKIKNALLNYLWYQWCECSSGTPSPAFSPPSAPSGFNYPKSTAGSSCYAGTWSGTAENDQFNAPIKGNAWQACYAGTKTTLPGSPTITAVQINTPIPIAVQVTVTINWTTTNASDQVAAGIAFANSSGTFLSPSVEQVFPNPGVLGPATYQFGGNVPATTAYMIGIFAEPNAVVTGLTGTMQTVYTCSGQTVGLPATPCEADPALFTLLQQVYMLAKLIYAGLPVPINSFAESTVHSPLSGSGNTAIGTSTIALKVELTTIPTAVGVESGDPTEYFAAGFITTSAAEGAYKSIAIEHTPQLIILGTLVDAFHWTLSPGVVAKVTELTRGP